MSSPGRAHRYLRLLTAAVLALGIVAFCAAPAPAAPDPEAYRGAGTWVDLYDPKALRDPVRAVSRMQSKGVRTLYLETANYRQRPSVDIVYPSATEQFIDAAHAAGIKVVAWYLPSFTKPRRDLRRSLAAINFTTDAGERFDSFALDIEANLVKSVAPRNRALLRLSRRIRRAVGPDYPLGAIVPDKRSTAVDLPSLWPGFPYGALASIYDVFLPMSYSSSRGQGADFVYSYTRKNISHLRRQTGDGSLPVHVIGGIANTLDRGEAQAVVNAARDGGALGAGFYKYGLSGSEEWRALAALTAD